MLIRTKHGLLLYISKAKQADCKEILALQHIAYQSEAALFKNYIIPPLKQTLDDLEQEFLSSTVLKVVDDNGKIVGSVRGRIVDESVLIGKLIVSPIMQGQGIGTKLLEEIERVCESNRYELFTSSKSTLNIKLYEKVGYSIFKEEKMNDDIRFIYLQKLKKRKK